MSNYGKYVKEMYWPKVSEQKQGQMASLKDKLAQENTAKRQAPRGRPSLAPDAWKQDLINKSHSQANLPGHRMDVRSNGS